MLFWIIAAIIALAVAAMLAAPLLRGRGTHAGAEDVTIYRDQLAEVDRDLARAVLAPEEAERARTEIARRLLSADRESSRADGDAPRRASLVLAGGVAVVVAGGALALYSDIGAPGYPDVPLASRIEAAEARLANLPPQAGAEAAVADLIAANIVTPPDNIAATVAQLRAAVDANPEAYGEMTLLRDFEAGVRNFPEAARLTSRLNAAAGFDLTLDDLLLELDLMVLSTNGIVSAEAAAVLDQAEGMDPDNIGVRFFRGLLAQGIGRPDETFTLWRPIAEDTTPSPWRDRVRRLIPGIAFEAGVDYTPPAEARTAGPNAADLAAAAEMNPEARAEMVQQMVVGLAQRLATQGGTADEWGQLIRALGVMGDIERARAIWTEAQRVFADDPDLEIIRAAAVEAGVEG